MRLAIVSFDKGKFDISLSAASLNMECTISLQACEINVYAAVCGCVLLAITSATL
jgi:hypothetical protein